MLQVWIVRFESPIFNKELKNICASWEEGFEESMGLTGCAVDQISRWRVIALEQLESSCLFGKVSCQLKCILIFHLSWRYGRPRSNDASQYHLLPTFKCVCTPPVLSGGISPRQLEQLSW